MYASKRATRYLSDKTAIRYDKAFNVINACLGLVSCQMRDCNLTVMLLSWRLQIQHLNLTAGCCEENTLLLFNMDKEFLTAYGFLGSSYKSELKPMLFRGYLDIILAHPECYW